MHVLWIRCKSSIDKRSARINNTMLSELEMLSVLMVIKNLDDNNAGS